VLADLWDRVTAVQPLPDSTTALLTVAVAAVLVLVPFVWPVTRHVVTVAHEGGHAVVAVLAGRRLSGIRLHSDTSGLTVSRGRPTGLGMVMTLLAGYTAPALVGLGAAWVLAQGRPVALLWGVLLLLALLLLQIRNLFGLWVVLVCGLGAFAVTWWASAEVQQWAAWTLTWFLLLGAPRAVLELARSRRSSRGTSDPDQLARLTRVPAVLWVFGFVVVTVGAAVLASRMLLGW
jgi:hypothetical protein